LCDITYSRAAIRLGYDYVGYDGKLLYSYQ